MSQKSKLETTKDLRKVTPIKAAKSKKLTYVASEDAVAELNTMSVMYASLKSQLSNMIETHAKDENDVLTKAPLFLGLVKSAAEDNKEFEQAKYAIEDELPVDDGFAVSEWNCDFETRKVVYEVMKNDTSRSEKQIQVPEEVYTKVWDAQLMHQTISDVIAWLNDTHAMDRKDTISSSAVFQGVLLLKAKLFNDFEKAKTEMYEDIVPVEDKAKYANWNLSYKNGILTLM